MVKAFEELFQHPMTTPLSRAWIDDYRKSRPKVTVPIPVAVTPEKPPPPPEPHTVQKEALEALDQTRAEGNQAGLVVLATGFGKTWLAAFDTVRFGATAGSLRRPPRRDPPSIDETPSGESVPRLPWVFTPAKTRPQRPR